MEVDGLLALAMSGQEEEKDMGIRVEKHGRQEPTIQINARIDPELAKKVRIFAVTHGVGVAAMVEAGLKAVLAEGAKAVVG